MTKAAGTLGGLPGRRFSGWLVLLDDIGIVSTSGELLEPDDLLAVGEIATFALISSSLSLLLLRNYCYCQCQLVFFFNLNELKISQYFLSQANDAFQ